VATEDCLDGIDNDCSGDSDCDDWAACKNIEPTCWVCGDGYQDVNEDCDDNNNLNGDGCDSNCISEMDLSGLYGSWSSESRTVYVFKSNSNAPLSDYNTFCADRGLSWFNPMSSSDAQTAITNCYNYDAYHTWIITDAPTGSSTWNGYSVTVDSPSCVDYSSSGLSAIRKWGCSYCDPENHGVTACWDGHVYDWLLCEGP
jgi:cysteine-rich repeat protein